MQLINASIQSHFLKKDHFFSRAHVYDISRLLAKILYNSNKSDCWNIVDELPSTRENFFLRIIRLNGVKKYNFLNYEENEKDISGLKQRFWKANRKVSSKKITTQFNYSFLFPSYLSGLKHIIKHS